MPLTIMQRRPFRTACRTMVVVLLTGSSVRLETRQEFPAAEVTLTIEQTVDYIRNRLAQAAFWDNDRGDARNVGKTSVAGVSGCTLTLEMTSRNTGTYQDTTVVTTTDVTTEIPLWALEAKPGTGRNRYNASHENLYLRTRDGRATLRTVTSKKNRPYREDDPDTVTETMESSFVIVFGSPSVDNNDVAERVASAFSHAIKLCCEQEPAEDDPFAPPRSPCGKQ